MRQLSGKIIITLLLVLAVVFSSYTPAIARLAQSFDAGQQNTVTAVQAGEPYIQESDTRLTMGNDYLELGFDKTTDGGLDTVIDKQTGIDLRPNKAPPALLFLLHFWNGSAVEGALQWDGMDVAYDTEVDGDAARATLRYTSLKGYAVDLTVKVTVTADSPLARLRLSITNDEPFILKNVYFPLVWGLGSIGNESTDDAVFYPAGDGMVLHDPLSQLSNLVISGGMYPGTLSMQVMSYYDPDETGMYMATYDTGGNPKTINFGPMEWTGAQHLAASFQLFLPESPGNDYGMDYDAMLGTFHGDWHAAATRYKAWAETTPFIAGGKVFEDKDTPRWLADTTIVQFLNRDHPDREVFSLADIADMTEEYAASSGVNTTALIMGWEHNGAWVGPNYYPPVEGETAFQQTMDTLETDCNHGFTYISGTVWRITRDDIGYANYPYFNSTGLPWVALTEAGQPLYDAFYESIGWHSARMDPMTDFWHQMVVDNALEGVRLGVDVIQIDEFPIGAIYPCYNASHGHPLGYSAEVARAYTVILQDIRQQGRTMNPDFALSMEEPCEYYLPYVDLYVSRDNAPEALLYPVLVDTYGDRLSFVPFFSFVYHEYVAAFGESTSMDDNRVATYYDQMARGIARNFASGEIMKGTGTTSDSRNKEIFELFMRTARAATTYAAAYLLEGTPLAPPDIVVPSKPIQWLNEYTGQPGTTIHEPVVMHSAWQSDDGWLGLAFVNWNTQTMDFDIEIPSYDLAGRYYSLLLTRNGQTEVISYNVSLPVTVNLSLGHNDVVLMEAVGTVDNLAPNRPEVAGPTQGKINTEYGYTAVSTDPDGDEVYYLFDWGDGTQSPWTGPFASGEQCQQNYTWTDKGTYRIRVKSRDQHGMESEWSDGLPVSMPKLWTLFQLCFQRLSGALFLLGRLLFPWLL